MRSPGEYNTRLEWLVQSKEQDAIGQFIESFTGGSYLWALMENQSSSFGTQYRADKTSQTFTARIRQKPTIKAKDRLTDTRTNETWAIESLYYDFAEDETVCDLRREP